MKVIAILLIILSHCTQTLEKFTDFQAPTTDIQLLILRFFRFDGQLGNIIFVIASSWFLLDSKKVKNNKAIQLALNSQVISVGIMVVFVLSSLVLKFRINYSADFFLHNIFPDLFEQVWFIPTYIIFYLIHPYLNEMVHLLTQRGHFFACVFIFAFYGICGRPAFSRLMGFIMIFIVTAYVKKYCSSLYNTPKKCFLIWLIATLLFIAAVIAKNFLAMKIAYFKSFPEMNELTSVFLLPMMLSLFLVFLNLNFYNKFVNYLSSLSIFVYCIHENALVRETLRPRYYEFVIDRFGDEYLLLYDLVLFVMLTILSFLASSIYKAISQKTVDRISVVLEKKITAFVTFLFRKTSNLSEHD